MCLRVWSLTAVAAFIFPFCAGCCLENVAWGNFAEQTVSNVQAAPEPASPRGAKLWAENCRRCHELRAPDSYSSDQWGVALNHMRLRAGLTDDDAKEIGEFLKAFRR